MAMPCGTSCLQPPRSNGPGSWPARVGAFASTAHMGYGGGKWALCASVLRRAQRRCAVQHPARRECGEPEAAAAFVAGGQVLTTRKVSSQTPFWASAGLADSGRRLGHRRRRGAWARPCRRWRPGIGATPVEAAVVPPPPVWPLRGSGRGRYGGHHVRAVREAVRPWAVVVGCRERLAPTPCALGACGEGDGVATQIDEGGSGLASARLRLGTPPAPPRRLAAPRHHASARLRLRAPRRLASARLNASARSGASSAAQLGASRRPSNRAHNASTAPSAPPRGASARLVRRASSQRLWSLPTARCRGSRARAQQARQAARGARPQHSARKRSRWCTSHPMHALRRRIV